MMRRRSFLQAAGCGAVMLALPSAVAQSKNTPRFRSAFGLNGFASGERKYGKKYPIREILAFAREVGFEGVELVERWPEGTYPAANDTDAIGRLRDLYDEYGITVFSIQLGTPAAFSPDRGQRDQWLTQFRDRAAFAKAMGADCIGMWPFGPLRGQTIDQAIGQLAGSYSQAANIADDLGLVAAFEIEPPFQFNTEQHLSQILERANNSKLKTIYDPSHFDLMSGSRGKPHEMLKRIGVENIGYLHLTDCDGTLRDGGTSKHLAWGDGHIDTAKSMQTLIEGGFRGWVMIDGWEIPDVYDACRKGKLAIDAANQGA